MAFRRCFFHFFLHFFETPEVTKIVLPKVLQNFKLPKELNQKGFPHMIQYRTRPKGTLQIFWSFATDWMLKNPKGSPFSFSGIVKLFFKRDFRVLKKRKR